MKEEVVRGFAYEGKQYVITKIDYKPCRTFYVYTKVAQWNEEPHSSARRMKT